MAIVRGEHLLAICHDCGERALPMELNADCDKVNMFLLYERGLIEAGWLIAGDMTFCPGCHAVEQRKRASN